MYPRYVLLECTFVEEKDMAWGVTHTDTDTDTHHAHARTRATMYPTTAGTGGGREKGGVPVGMHACSVPLEVYSFLSLC